MTVSAFRNPRGFAWLAVLLAGALHLLCGAPSARADRTPADCIGSGLGISLFTGVSTVQIGGTIYYSIQVFNGIPDSGRIACDATAIQALILTPDGVTNLVNLTRTTLHQGESDFYLDVVSYVARSQDMQPDGTLRATARAIGIIHDNHIDSSGGGFQGVNTEVNLPCVLTTALCMGPAGTNGVNGVNGLNGTNGLDGAIGPMGIPGAMGATGMMGLTGLTGAMGATGLSGTNGLNGTNGVDGTVGPMGIPGAIGATGATGMMGLTGLTGAMGATGLSGTNGLNGTNGVDGTVGPMGLPGAIGATGATGMMGLTGLTGAMGATGLSGTNGVNGTNGLDGAVGPPGPASSLQYRYIYNLGAQVVSLEAPVAFSDNGIGTTGIAHGLGSSSVTFAIPGAYKVAFSVSGTEPNQFALFLNGVLVAGSVYGSGAGTQQNTGQAILVIGASDVLTLVNHASAAAVTLAAAPPIGGTAPAVNASLLIQKLD